MQTNWRTIVVDYATSSHAPHSRPSATNRMRDISTLLVSFHSDSGRQFETLKPRFSAFNYDSSHNSVTPSRVNHVEETVCVFSSSSFFFLDCRFVFIYTVNYWGGGEGGYVTCKKFVLFLLYVDSHCEGSSLFFLWICSVILADIRVHSFNGGYFLPRLFCLWLVVIFFFSDYYLEMFIIWFSFFFSF